MRLIPSDPDLETIIGRIKDGSLDLQPDFQRGAVWSRPKQRLLIDSILRSWYVPPIHVVRTEDDAQEVLDGQQRLRAIFEFVLGRFSADGRTEPFNEEIAALNGHRYDELPERIRRRFDRFTLRLFELVDYEPEEPYELFFRLNQPTTLTAAEKRNAFFGEARAQIKQLAERAQGYGMTPERVGFSNARLAYEDVIARFVWTLEVGSLAEKVTAGRVTSRYRAPEPIGVSTLEVADAALRAVFGLPALDHEPFRLNKATAHTWLLFVTRALYHNEELRDLNGFFAWVEEARGSRKAAHDSAAVDSRRLESVVISVLNDRATSRVNDVSSVLLRDAVLWVLYSGRVPQTAVAAAHKLREAVADIESPRRAEESLLRAADEQSWGTLS